MVKFVFQIGSQLMIPGDQTLSCHAQTTKDDRLTLYWTRDTTRTHPKFSSTPSDHEWHTIATTATVTASTHTHNAHTTESSSMSRRSQSPRSSTGSKMVARMVLSHTQAAALSSTDAAPPSPAQITAIPATAGLSMCAGMLYLMLESSARRELGAGDDLFRMRILQTVTRSNVPDERLRHGMLRDHGARGAAVRVCIDPHPRRSPATML